MEKDQWLKLMDQISIPENTDTFDALVNAYSENHRHYHTVAHIRHCLNLFELYRDVAERPADVELAIWFHDAIYKPLSKDNEAQSAKWAEEFLIKNARSKTMIDLNHKLIMATVHNAPAMDTDVQLLVDIDLSILGSEPEVFDAFETNVRREYKWVPSLLYRRERKKILQSFVDRDVIYSTQVLRRKYELQARENLTNVIRSLQLHSGL